MITRFNIRREDSSLTIDHINTSLSNLLLTGFADWVKAGRDQRSWLNAKLSGNDIAKLQTFLNMPTLITAESSVIDTHLIGLAHLLM